MRVCGGGACVCVGRFIGPVLSRSVPPASHGHGELSEKSEVVMTLKIEKRSAEW